jgi:hypothetical protein
VLISAPAMREHRRGAREERGLPMQVERSDVSPLTGREALHRITEAVLSLTQQGRVLRVLSARAYSVVCEPVRVAFLSRASLDQRAYEPPNNNGDRGTTYTGRSGTPSPLLAADTQAGLYVGKPCCISLAGRAQRQAPTRGGGRVLSGGDSWPAPRAFASPQAKNRQTGHTTTQSERRSSERGCHPRSQSTRGVEAGQR